jgi:hypothetical protein
MLLMMMPFLHISLGEEKRKRREDIFIFISLSESELKRLFIGKARASERENMQRYFCCH